MFFFLEEIEKERYNYKLYINLKYELLYFVEFYNAKNKKINIYKVGNLISEP